MVVPRGNYTQIRVSGFGYGDESLENDISQVEMSLGFASDMEKNLDRKKKILSFDLMVFENTDDYLCYVEAVHLLMHEGIKKNCDFLLDTVAFQDSTPVMNVTKGKFLYKDQRVKEYFFVLDNTEYPEALQDPSWTGVTPRPEDGSKDVQVELSFEFTFTSNDKYFAWTFVFTLVLVALIIVFMISAILYIRMVYLYNRHAMERRNIKRELMKIKDTEYKNFLLMESQTLSSKPKAVAPINSSLQHRDSETTLDEEEEDSN
mmetsp:Transcript_17700/g.29938  ORF Transcript_17700/g.29938 Transcript_17700/m.29938 type:complete len:261 (-) Transcript_17700:333-1115(-)